MYIFILIYRCCQVTPSSVNTLLSLKYNPCSPLWERGRPTTSTPSSLQPPHCEGREQSPGLWSCFGPLGSSWEECGTHSGTHSMSSLHQRTKPQLQAPLERVFLFLAYCWEITSEVKDFVRNTWSDKFRSKSWIHCAVGQGLKINSH